MTELPRRRALLAATLGAALAVAACGGSASPTPSPSPTPVPTATPSPTPAPTATPTPVASTEPTATPAASIDLSGMTEKVSKFKSYKTVLSITGIGGVGDIGITTKVQTVPLKSQELEIDAAGQHIGVITIEGKGTWMKQGTAAWTVVPAATASQLTAAYSQFAPDVLLKSFNLDQVSGSLDTVGTETRNGVAAIHLRADPVKMAALPNATDVPKDLKMDLWIAQSGDYVVALEFSATVDVSGTATPMTMNLDVSNVDDPGLTIEQP